MTTYSLVRGGALREQGIGRSQTPKHYQGKPTLKKELIKN